MKYDLDSQKKQYIVKSSSTKYRTVSVLLDSRITCEKSCLGFESRKICAHVIAVAIYLDRLKPFLETFVKNSTLNLSKMATTNVNSNAGKKGRSRKRVRASSPDVMCKPYDVKVQSATLGNLFEEQDTSDFSVSHISRSAIKMKIKKPVAPEKPKATKKPVKPIFQETTATDFELIMIKGRISVCQGCPNKLKAGPIAIPSDPFDKDYCVRHKEHDHAYLQTHNYWTPTFDNKHYHMSKDCIIGRNPSFEASEMRIEVEVSQDLKTLLRERFYGK